MERGSTSMVRAGLMVLGTVVGAGTFALPAAFRSAGILAGSLAFWAMALSVLCLHLLYTEVVLARRDLMRLRLIGQVRYLLGVWPGRVACLVYPAKLVAAMLAYLVLGGEFLSTLAGQLGIIAGATTWQIVFWAGGVATVAFGLAMLARIEAVLTWMLVGLVFASVGLFLPRADGGLFATFAWPPISAVPLGTFVFSLIGWTVIPEAAELVRFDGRRTRLAVAAGSLGAAFLMWAFGVSAYAANGGAHLNGPSSIAQALPSGWAWLIPAVGFLAIATSFVTVAESLRATLAYDLGLAARSARLASLLGPFIILFLTTRDFFRIVDFTGSYLSTVNALLVCAMAWTVIRTIEHRREPWRLAMPWACGAMFLFVLLQHPLLG